MSLHNILQKIQQKGRIKSVLPGEAKPASASGNSSLEVARPANDRPIDPVVARLKAARKAEKEKKEQELREKKGLQPKKETKPRARPVKAAESRSPAQSSRIRNGAGGNGKNGRAQMGGVAVAPSQPTEKKLKMSFSELMKKASLIDQSKMSIAIKQKTKSPENVRPRRTPRPDGESRQKNGESARSGHSSKTFRSDRVRPNGPSAREAPNRHGAGNGGRDSAREPRDPRPEMRAPLPTRQPSEKLQAQLKGRQSAAREEEEYDEDDWGSFIASDEEEEQQAYGGDYDRDEIWSMFNKGRKRSYYTQFDDEDSDDMEATGAEILEEEQRSKRRAMEEDMREMKEEQKLAAMKQARKAKIGRK